MAKKGEALTLTAEEKRLGTETLRELGDLITACAMSNVSIRIEFDNGMTVPYALLLQYEGDANKVPESQTVQGPQGYTLEIGGTTRTDPSTSRQKLYRSMEKLVQDGWEILYYILGPK